MSQDSMVAGTVDVRVYLRPLLRQKRFIAMTTLVVVLIAGVYTFTRTSIYTAKTTVLVKPTGVNLLETGPLGTLKLLNLDTEVQLVGSTPVATLAAKSIGAGALPADLLKHVSASAVTTSQALQISFSDPSPSVAQRGAAAFAAAYLTNRQTQAEQLVATQQAKIAAALAAAETRIRKDDGIITSSPASSAAVQTAKTDRANAQDQIGALKTQETGVALLNTQPGQILVAAETPKQPSSPDHTLDIGLGLFLGLGLGLGIAFVRGRADQHMREAADLEDVLGRPSLASIPKVPGPQGGIAGLVAAHQTNAPASEAYRALRTTVMAALGSGGTLLVVSAFPGEGKTTVASNLAVMLARTEKRVVLVSADMRRPLLHELFGLPNLQGLSDILAGDRTLEECLLTTDFPNLIVCPAGPVPAEPAELLQSKGMLTLLAAVREAADFIILDCPPVLTVADALVLVPMSDAAIFVTDSVGTKRGAVAEARNHLEQVGANLLGGVLNNVPPPGAGGYGYGYGYGPLVEAAN